MAHHKSAIKRIRTNRTRNLRNRRYRSMMRTSIRRFREALDAESRRERLHTACAILDRMASKGIIHRNTAARRKSRLHRYASRLET